MGLPPSGSGLASIGLHYKTTPHWTKVIWSLVEVIWTKGRPPVTEVYKEERGGGGSYQFTHVLTFLTPFGQMPFGLMGHCHCV